MDKNINFQLKNASLYQRERISNLCLKFGIQIHCPLEKADLTFHPDVIYVGNNHVTSWKNKKESTSEKEPICIDSCRDSDYEELTFYQFVNRIISMYEPLKHHQYTSDHELAIKNL